MNQLLIDVFIAEYIAADLCLIRKILQKDKSIKIHECIIENPEYLFEKIKDCNPDIVFVNFNVRTTEFVELFKNTIFVFLLDDTSAVAHWQNDYFFDYIVKPITKEKIIQSINRSKKTIWYLRENKLYKLYISYKREHYLINIEDILFIEKSHNKLTVIHLRSKYYVTYETLDEIYSKLLFTEVFFRSHKSYILNIQQIDKISLLSNGTYKVEYANSDKFALVSKSNYSALKELLIYLFN